MTDKLQTRQTLLQRAKDPADELAWSDFVAYYSDFIKMVLWKMSVPASEHDDLRQEILIKLWTEVQSFELDHSKSKFRTWLSIVIRNSVLHYMRSVHSTQRREASADQNDRAFSVTNDDELGKLIGNEWVDYVGQLVVDHLKQFFSGKAIDVFLLSNKGKTTEQISNELEIPPNTVYVLRNRVKVRFMKELKELRRKLEF